MSESAPMIGPPDGSFAEAPWPEQPSGILESTEPLADTRRVLRGQARMASEYGAIAGPMGEPQPPMEPDEKIGAEVLNKQYGIPGKLTFADPLPDSVARSMYETKIDEIKQQDITRRAPAGFVSGAARFGAQFAVGFLDPLQIGAAMVPIAPELEFGASLGARIGARAAEGAIGGLAGTAPLVGLQYGLSRQEQSDFTAYDALFGLAQGAGFGAGIGALSAGGGAFGRALSERYGRSRAAQVAEADPSVRTGALQTILSQTEQEHPGEVRPIYDQANAPNVPEEAGYGAVEPMGTPRATAFLPETEPLGLTSFLQKDFTVGREGDVNAERRAGGLRDPGGDLDAIIGGPRGRPGLINNDSGSSFREAALRAKEAGYFDHVPEDKELLAAIEKDHNRTNPHDAVYSAHDQDAADAYRYARTRNVEIDQLSAQTGIPTEGLTHAQFWDQVADHLSLEESQAHVDRFEQEHADAFEQAEQAAKEWIAHHGTPHEFERFDTAHIGTGEGLQAYGHGLYFAEHPDVAESYRRALSVGSDAVDAAQEEFYRTYDALQKSIEGDKATYEAAKAAHESAAADLAKARAENAGNLYTVRLRAKPEEMLDWDRSLSAQPEVLAKIAPLLEEHLGYDAYQAASLTGNEAHDMLATALGGKPAVAEALRKAGVKGIHYADAQSRATPMLSAKGLAQYFRPGELVEGYGGMDRVVAFHPPDENYRWSVQVQEVDREGKPKGPVRTHSTMPDAREIARDEKRRGETFDRPEGTRNVVMFDHNDVEITHRNGEPVERKPFDPEEVYRSAPHTLEEMEHEWHQAESAHPISPGEGGGGQPGPAAEHPGDVQGGAGQVPGTAGAAGRAGPEERSQILRSALRDAAGQRPPDPTGLAAERALKEGDEKNLVKLAQQDIENHTAFFKAMSDANLQKEVGAIPTTPTGVPLKPTDGWKLHLNVEPGSRLAAEAEAEAMRLGAVQTKQGHNSGQEGKGVTIYIGSRDRATRIARGLAEKFELPEPTGEALVDDIPFAKGVVGRFDVGSTDRDFHQYGRDGDPILLDRVSYEKPYFSDEAMAVSRKELIRRYGEFYTGSKGGEVATGPYAGLTAEVRAEIERIHQEVDTDAANRIAAAKQAAACIARGIGGRMT